MPKIDPITLAVVQNNLISIVNEVQATIFRTSVTPLIYEQRDCSQALLDPKGGTIAQGSGSSPLYLGTFGPAIRKCLDVIGEENFEPGDIIIAAHPFFAGTHAPDALLFAPVFYTDKLFCYVATKGHWQDLGAKTPYPTDSMSCWEEGLKIPPTKFHKAGKFQPEIWGIIKWNSRAPDDVWGDMQAQIAACHVGERRIAELLDRYGMETVNACIEEMYDYSERMTRAAIEKIPDGTWSAEDYADNNGVDLDKLVKIKVTVTVKGSDITIDFTGSDKEQDGPVNSPFIVTQCIALSAVKALTTPELPLNEGCYRPVKVIAPEGTVFNPNTLLKPTFLYMEPVMIALEAINKALHPVIPQKVPAYSAADMGGASLYGVHPETGKFWLGIFSMAVIGQGADFFADGQSALMDFVQASARNVPSEIYESLYPVFVERVGFDQDTGGAGEHRGGLGSSVTLRMLKPASYSSFMDKSKTPHWGLAGGKPGGRNYAVIHSKTQGDFEMCRVARLDLDVGDKLTFHAGGGGGYGDPLKRDPEKVRQDVINGYVSVEHAKEDCGVAIDRQTFDIDIEATRRLRGID